MLLTELAIGRHRSELEQELEDSRIVVTLNPQTPASLLTARLLLTTLRRRPGHLLLERSGLSLAAPSELADAVEAVDPGRPLTVSPAAPASRSLLT